MVDILTEGTYEQCRAIVATIATRYLSELVDMTDHEDGKRAARDELAAREARTVRPLDITLDLGSSDHHTLASPQGLYKGRPALLLRFRDKRYGDTFSVLYNNGTNGRTGDHMPWGKPHASLIPQASVIAAHGTGATAITHDVELGETVTIDGNRLTVTAGTFSNYPALLPE